MGEAYIKDLEDRLEEWRKRYIEACLESQKRINELREVLVTILKTSDSAEVCKLIADALIIKENVRHEI